MFRRCGTGDRREVSGKGTGGELEGPEGGREQEGVPQKTRSVESAGEVACKGLGGRRRRGKQEKDFLKSNGKMLNLNVVAK